LSRLYLSWFDASVRDQKRPSQASVDKLLLSMKYAPDSRPAIERCISFIQTALKSGEPQKMVINSLRSADLSAHEHLVFGSIFFAEKFPEEALHHLECAHAKDVANPDILNNLAWYVAHQASPDLDRSLALANQLVRIAPKRLEFRETRGQIFMLRDQWQAARRDLEAAESVLADYPELHRALVRVYGKLGLPSKAATHQKILDRLSNR
jgi:tetratricopeptide (TPR) repeat protein